ncbi:MAG TPA: 30S ribosomal protein S4 [Polyangiaceae bacterium]|nr:30S ribosomal protein S4 [Polyangiaceae bacterium]
MSRYIGPKVRVLRALGTDLPGLTRKKSERRPTRPGQHGQARKKFSEYALRLIEKQKLRMNYGLCERQLLRLFMEAAGTKGNTAERLVELLERRLDNVVFRAGFARTIPAARQLIMHGHVQVENKKVDIPSFRIKRGQSVSIRERSRQLTSIASSLATPLSFPTDWLSVNPAELTATVTALPDVTAIPFPIRLQLVVEFYSQRT